MTSYSAFAAIASALFVFMLMACAPTKTSISLEKEREREEANYSGEVTTDFAKDGCPVLIQYKDSEELKYLIPVQLDEQFKKHGLKISFSFHYSRIMQGECQMGQPAVLEDIKVL